MKRSDLLENMDLIYEYIELDKNAMSKTESDIIEHVYFPAATEHIMNETGLTLEQLDEHEDLTIAILAATREIYDNKGMTTTLEQKKNEVVERITGHHRMNLV